MAAIDYNFGNIPGSIFKADGSGIGSVAYQNKMAYNDQCVRINDDGKNSQPEIAEKQCCGDEAHRYLYDSRKLSCCGAKTYNALFSECCDEDSSDVSLQC